MGARDGVRTTVDQEDREARWITISLEIHSKIDSLRLSLIIIFDPDRHFKEFVLLLIGQIMFSMRSRFFLRISQRH